MAEDSTPLGLVSRLDEHLESRSWYTPGEPLVVAVSGGLDSVVLLHLLRFGRTESPLVVAHFDHRMRPDSEGDRLWVKGLARTWGLDFVSDAATEPLTSEAAARKARYAFFEGVRSRVGARWVVTAHHADDQAETVLHRALRGTGPDGLAGIREAREPGVARPLLSFHRSELESYAVAARLSHRVDPTNADVRFTRNWIRHEILPRVDEGFGVAGRRALARLGRLSAVDAEAWESVLEAIEGGLLVPRGAEEVVLDARAFLEQHEGVRARLVRRWAARLGVTLGARQTELVTRFVQSARSGAVLSPRAGLRVAREFEQIVFSVPGDENPPVMLQIEGVTAGSGRVSLGARSFVVQWSTEELEPSAAGWVERFSPELHYPLRVRAWRPGDRLVFDFGSKKLKKIFGEARVPLGTRGSVPLLVDSEDRVLWVPGVARSRLALPGGGKAAVTICFEEEVS